MSIESKSLQHKNNEEDETFPEEYHLSLSELHSRRANESATAFRATS